MTASDSLREAIIAELLALTGETPGTLWKWLKEEKSIFPPVLNSRSQFHKTWSKFALPREKQEKTRGCCLGERPLACRLRFRVVRFSITDSDKENDQGRTYLILVGYEVCTSWLGYVLFDDAAALPESPVGLPVSKFIEFYQSAARSIGLPLSSIQLTNCFLLGENWRVMTMIDTRKVLVEQREAGNLPHTFFAMDDSAAMPKSYTFDLIQKSLLTTNLLGLLDNFMNVHNENFAISKIEKGRKAMHKLARSSKKDDFLRQPMVNERRMKEPHIAKAIPKGKLIVSSKLHKLS